MKNQNKFEKVDHIVVMVSRVFSVLSVAAILVMAFISVIDIIASTFFGKAIAIQSDLIKYLMILVVFCFLPNLQLERGVLVVDIFSRKYGPGFAKAITVIGCVLGVVIFAVFGVRGCYLLKDYFVTKTRNVLSEQSFLLWPFALVYVIGTFMTALAFLWSVIRQFVKKKEGVAS